MGEKYLDFNNDSVFVEKISNKIKKLSAKQKVHFSWLCAVRALPFMGVGEYFDYFCGLYTLAHKDDKQETLFSLFWTLDLIAALIFDIPSKYNIWDPDPWESSYTVSCDVKNLVKETKYKYADTVFSAAYAAQAIAHASEVIIYGNGSEDGAIEHVIGAACNADAACFTFNKYSKSGFQELLLSDIDKICSNKTNEIISSLYIYGVCWENFLTNLSGIKCGYWADLYEDFFLNNFQFDMQKLETRVNIPEEIRKNGASKIAKWLVKN